MWSRLILSVGVYELAVNGLFQAEMVSESVFKALEQYPPLVAVIVVAYYMYKMQRQENETTRQWLEHMLQIERISLKEVYDGQSVFLSTLLAQIEAKQNNMSDRIELLTQQVAVNTSTVSEIAKVDMIISELIAKLEQK